MRELIDKINIHDQCRIFNLDEWGFDIRGMNFSANCIVRSGTRWNTSEFAFKGTVDHVMLMTIVSVPDQIMKPLVVLPGVEANYRRMANGKYEARSDYLLKLNCLYMRRIDGVDTNILYSWTNKFVTEKSHLRTHRDNILLVMDGFSGHMTYKTSRLLRDNGIVVAGLPTHTPHVLQPLDITVFELLKQEFKGIQTIN